MSREFKNFQNNLHHTTLGAKLGKKLFLNPSSISPHDLANALRALGLPVSKDALMAADAAQLVVTGSAAITAAETAENINSVVSPTAASMKILASIAGENKWIDQDSMQMIQVGADVAMIIASGGADVGAWVSLALEFYSMSSSNVAKAQMLSQKYAQQAYSGEMQKEQAAFGDAIKGLESGQLGIFSFLVEVSQKGSLIFETAIVKNPAFEKIREKLPMLNFIPPQYLHGGHWQFQGHDTETTWYGESSGERHSEINVDGFANFGSEANQVMSLFNLIIGSFGYDYLKADALYRGANKVSIFDIAKLAMLGNRGFILRPEMNLLDTFLKYQLTPGDLGVSGTFENYHQNVKDSAISSNFGFSKQRKIWLPEQVQFFDENGMIDQLSQIREAQELVPKKFDFFKIDEYDEFSTAQGERQYYWRDFANFMSFLDMLDLVHSDPQYAKYKDLAPGLKAYDIFPKLADFKKECEKIWKLSAMRRVNKIAELNVANFLGAPINKIKKLTPPDHIGPVFYNYK